MRTRLAWVLVMEVFDELRRVVELSGEEPQCLFISTGVTSPADEVEELAVASSAVDLGV